MMREETKTQLSRLFSEHASTMDAERLRRDFRDREEERREEEFQIRFDTYCRETIVPLLEDMSREVQKGGHSCKVASVTHGKFFSGPSNAPGVIFMFYPGNMAPEEHVLKPFSSHIAVFGDVSKQQVQIHSMVVLPGGFTPGKRPELLPLEGVTADYLTGVCIDVIGETLHLMEPGKTRMVASN